MAKYVTPYTAETEYLTGLKCTSLVSRVSSIVCLECKAKVKRSPPVLNSHLAGHGLDIQSYWLKHCQPQRRKQQMGKEISRAGRSGTQGRAGSRAAVGGVRGRGRGRTAYGPKLGNSNTSIEQVVVELNPEDLKPIFNEKDDEGENKSIDPIAVNAISPEISVPDGRYSFIYILLSLNLFIPFFSDVVVDAKEEEVGNNNCKM